MLREKKWLRVLSWLLGGIIVGLLLALITLSLILKSPPVQQRIVTSLKGPLARQGLALGFKSLSIDPFAGVRLEGLTVVLKRAPEAAGTFQVETLLLRYKFWPLFSGRLEVREARITGVSGDLTLTLPPPQPKSPPDPEAITKLLDLMRNPPAALDLPNIALERVSLRASVTQGPMSVKVGIHEMSLAAALQLEKGRSRLQMKADLPGDLDFTQADVALSTRLHLRPELSWQSTIEGQEFSWNLTIKDTQLHPEQASVRKAPGLEVKFEDLLVNLDMELDHKGLFPEKTVTALDVMLPLEAQGQLDLALDSARFADDAAGEAVLSNLRNRMSFKTHMPRDLEKSHEASWKLDHELNLSTLSYTKGGKSVAALPSLAATLRGEGNGGQGTIDLRMAVKQLGLPAFAKALDVNEETHLKLDIPQRQVDFMTKLELNQKPALLVQGLAADRNQSLQIKMKADAQTHPEWRTLHSGLEELDQFAWPKLSLNMDTVIPHSVPLEEIEDWSKLTITTNIDVLVVPSRAAKKGSVRFKKIALDLKLKTVEKSASGRLNLGIDGLEHPALRKPATLSQNLDFKADGLDLLRISLNGTTRLGDKDLLSLKLNLTEEPGRLHYRDEFAVRVDESLREYVDGLDLLRDLGPLELRSADQISLRYPSSRVSEVKNWDLARLDLQGKLTQTIHQSPHKGPYQLTKPVSIESTVKLQNNMLAAHTELRAPAVEAKELANASDVFARLTVGVKDISEQKLVLIDASGGAQTVTPLMAAAERVKEGIRRVKFGLKAEVFQKDRFVVEDVHASVDGDLLAFKGKGDVTLRTGRGGFTGQVKGTLPEGRAIAGLRGQGSFALPFTLTLYDRKVLAIESDPTFRNLSFRYLDDIEVKGLDGKLSLNEELSVDDAGRIGFLYLNTQNPFTRVDFENIDPYLGQRLSLKIEKLRFKHIEAGPVLTNLELRQNLILLNEMKANLLKGSALGRVFIDLHPERLQLGFLGRFSNLQLELLKEASRRQARLDELSGRAAANFDIRKRLATGRIDVTNIGRNQLLSTIDVLDPNYTDTQMMAARRALQISYPSLVSIAMDQGLMDLSIGLGGVVSTDINVRSIPLTAFINANAGESLSLIEKFLQTGGQ
jgi:hypothetical protein